MKRVGSRVLFGCWCLIAGPLAAWSQAQPTYLNPVAVEADAPRARAYVALAGASAIAVADVEAASLAATWPQAMTPTDLALSPDGQKLAVTLGETDGRVVLLRAEDGQPISEFDAGFSPVSPVWLRGDQLLAVCNRFTDTVSFYNTARGRRRGTVSVTREPCAAIATLDGERLFVGGGMPEQPADQDFIAVAVDVVDVARRKVIETIVLPNGSTGLQDMAMTPDGRYILVTHIVGHYQVPTNQLERGWMNANAVSVIDVEDESLLGTILLDDTTLGAANPWGVAVTADSRFLVVASAGTHEVSRIPWPALLARISESSSRVEEGGAYGIAHDLTVMTKVGRVRVRTGEGPRTVTTLGSKALVAEYFTGRLAVIDLDNPDVHGIKPQEIELGTEPEMDAVRQGELRFADARLCFQQWQSCMSCHPGMRADGLNWDLLNDGLGNPKQAKSLVFSHVTPPAMAHGIRASAEVAVRAGIRFIQFAKVDEEQASHIDAYLRSLRPLPSPYLVNGELSPLAIQGKQVFEKAGCLDCHSGEYYTDLDQHRVKHATALDGQRVYDTPTLREVWRTAPYLYDGRATTMKETLQIKDRGVADLSAREMRALIEYVLSL